MRSLTAPIFEEVLRRGGSYADVRFVASRKQRTAATNGFVTTQDDHESWGYGIRARFDGAWGHASGSERGLAAVREAAERAVSNARIASILGARGSEQGGESTADGTRRWEARGSIRPESVDLGTRTDFVRALSEACARSELVRSGFASVSTTDLETELYTTRGLEVLQSRVISGAWIQARAISETGIHVRSYPDSFGAGWTGGWERVEALELAAEAARVSDEAHRTATAPLCSDARRTIVARPSFLAPIVLAGALPTASPRMQTQSARTPAHRGAANSGVALSFWDDPQLDAGVGSWGFDATGRPTERRQIELGLSRSGARASRSPSWTLPPSPAATNVVVDASGSATEAQAVAGVERGLLIDGARAWHVDAEERAIIVGGEIGWEIRDGVLGDVVSRPTVRVGLPEVWERCDLLGGSASERVVGFRSGALAHDLPRHSTGVACPLARFRGVYTFGVANG